MRLSTGAIFRDTRPETIITSACRGEARKTSDPNRARSFRPLVAFIIWNSPPMTADIRQSAGPYCFILFTFVVVIAFAGITSNLRLLQLLRHLAGGRKAVALGVMLAWLAGNLFFGTQLSWILRPFIGAPGLQVQFLRKDAFKGNFYETIFHAAVRVFTFD